MTPFSNGNLMKGDPLVGEECLKRKKGKKKQSRTTVPEHLLIGNSRWKSMTLILDVSTNGGTRTPMDPRGPFAQSIAREGGLNGTQYMTPNQGT